MLESASWPLAVTSSSFCCLALWELSSGDRGPGISFTSFRGPVSLTRAMPSSGCSVPALRQFCLSLARPKDEMWVFSAPAFGNWPGLGPSPGGVGHWSPMPPTGPDSHGDPSCGAALHHWGPVGGGVKPQWVTPALHGISLPTQTQLEGVWTPTLCKAGLLMGSQTHLYPRCGIAIGGGSPCPSCRPSQEAHLCLKGSG